MNIILLCLNSAFILATLILGFTDPFMASPQGLIITASVLFGLTNIYLIWVCTLQRDQEERKAELRRKL